MTSIPSTMRAVVQTAPGVSSLETVPVPKVEFGSVLVKVEFALLHQNFTNIYNETLPVFRKDYPVIPGSVAVGRVVATGPDAATLSPGQLVLVNTFLLARDDPSIQIVRGATKVAETPAHNRLYNSLARNGAYAEYVLPPLEATFPLNEDRFLGDPSSGGLGYDMPDLLQLGTDMILYAGLRNIALQAGERIIITPATGHYSAATVDAAVAMGAEVVAASRNADGLQDLLKIHPTIQTVLLTGDTQVDSKALAAFGHVDVVADVSPPAATGSNNLEAAVSVLKPKGRVVLLGGRLDSTLPIPYMAALSKNLIIRGSFMYEQQDARGLLKLAESGTLKLGRSGNHDIVATYGIDQLEEAMTKAVEVAGPGKLLVIKP